MTRDLALTIDHSSPMRHESVERARLRESRQPLRKESPLKKHRGWIDETFPVSPKALLTA